MAPLETDMLPGCHEKRNLQDEPKTGKCQDGQGNARNGQPFLKGGFGTLGELFIAVIMHLKDQSHCCYDRYRARQ
jgi:hypothetical protein